MIDTTAVSKQINKEEMTLEIIVNLRKDLTTLFYKLTVNRPWVERKCGFPIQAGYRQGRDLIDDCEETEVTIEGIAGIKRTCSCSTDGCNGGQNLQWSWTLLFFPAIMAARWCFA